MALIELAAWQDICSVIKVISKIHAVSLLQNDCNLFQIL